MGRSKNGLDMGQGVPATGGDGADGAESAITAASIAIDVTGEVAGLQARTGDRRGCSQDLHVLASLGQPSGCLPDGGLHRSCLCYSGTPELVQLGRAGTELSF